jgi:hypothetical protein
MTANYYCWRVSVLFDILVRFVQKQTGENKFCDKNESKENSKPITQMYKNKL